MLQVGSKSTSSALCIACFANYAITVAIFLYTFCNSNMCALDYSRLNVGQRLSWPWHCIWNIFLAAGMPLSHMRDACSNKNVPYPLAGLSGSSTAAILCTTFFTSFPLEGCWKSSSIIWKIDAVAVLDFCEVDFSALQRLCGVCFSWQCAGSTWAAFTRAHARNVAVSCAFL